jgi:hypothetical protein
LLAGDQDQARDQQAQDVGHVITVLSVANSWVKKPAGQP